jgi:hypothetical protein
VRFALEAYLDRESNSGSAYEAAAKAGLIGCVRRAPKDLSTNSRFFEAMGTRVKRI